MAGTWPSNYTKPSGNSTFGAKVLSSNIAQGGFGVTDAIMISGHRTVQNKEDLYTIPTQILSSNNSNIKDTTGSDAVNQIWYVQTDKKYYRLKDYSNHGSESGWEESVLSLSMAELNSKITSSGSSSSESIKIINNTLTTYNNRITNLETAYTYSQKKVIEYDMAYSYNKLAYSWTQEQIKNNNTSISNLNTAYSYNKLAYSWTQEQITNLQNTLTTLLNNVIFRSNSSTNTYIWTGTLAEFNALTTKATNTTFIITDA